MIGAIPSWTLVVLLSLPILSEAQTSTVTVLFSSSSVSVTEGSNVGIHLIAQGTCNLGFSVNLIFQDGSANLLRDYLYVGYPAVTPSVTFAPGSLSSSVFNVIAIGNNAFDGQRSFTVGFELPDVPNLTLRKGAPDRLRVIIEDDDTVEVSFEQSSQAVRENVGSIQIRLTSSGFYASPFRVSFVCDEKLPVEARAGEDFASGIHSVTFDNSGRFQTFSTETSISIMDDELAEPVESFICVILRPHQWNGIITADHRATIFSILDDDYDSTVTILFNCLTVSVTEGSVVNIQLIAQGTYNQEFTVNLMFTSVTAGLGRDYLYSGYPATPSVTFSPGSQASSVLNVIAIDNNAFDGQRSFEVEFELPTVPDLTLRKGTPDTLLVSITDEESVTISFETPIIKQVQETAGSIPVKLKSKGLYSRAFEISFTCVELDPVEAKAGDDFKSTVHKVTFDFTGTQETQSSASSVTILDDRRTEATESFICVILRPLHLDGIVVETPNAIFFAIQDNDIIEVKFEQDSYMGEEGSSVIGIKLQATDFVEPFKVRIFTFPLDADAPEKKVEAEINADYKDPRKINGSHGVVMFDRDLGPRSSSLTIPLFSDNIVECTEYFGLTFVLLSENYPTEVIPVEPTHVLVAIEDINGPPTVTVQFKTPALAVTEGNSINIQLIAQATCDREFTIDLIFQDGSTSLGHDYLYPGYPDTIPSVTFAPGSLSSSVFTVMSIGNNVFDPGERYFSVEMQLPKVSHCCLRAVKPNALRVSIIDDDSVEVSFQRSAQNVRESIGSHPVQLKSKGIYSSPFQVSFTCMEIAPVEAEAGEDFTAQNVYNVIFKTTGISQTASTVCSIAILDNRISECTESFSCVITTPQGQNGVVVKNPNTLSLSILDDDLTFVRFKNSSYSVREDAGSVSIHLEAVQEDPENPGSYEPAKYTCDFSVRCRTRSQSAKSNHDFGTKSALVLFTDGRQFSIPFAVSIFCDRKPECPETFEVQCSIPQQWKKRVKFVGSNVATVEIIDNLTPPGGCTSGG